MKGPWRAEVKSKIFRKSSSNFPFGQGCCLISDFARLNSNKVVLLQISLRFEKVIFNNKYTFCVIGFLEPVMSSSRRIPWEAGWFLQGETLSVQACSSRILKKVLEKARIFCEIFAITHHSFLKLNEALCYNFKEGLDW